MEEDVRELESQVYCCGACGHQFEYREIRCYSRFCPHCGNFMAHIDDTERSIDKSLLVVGGYF
ncbi:MAG: hypothetical protein Q7T18_12985 [Sedimentisphaerales bacterium]|nr:hypothetical protein [Sedimentisphaerales bacterium]